MRVVVHVFEVSLIGYNHMINAVVLASLTYHEFVTYSHILSTSIIFDKIYNKTVDVYAFLYMDRYSLISYAVNGVM